MALVATVSTHAHACISMANNEEGILKERAADAVTRRQIPEDSKAYGHSRRTIKLSQYSRGHKTLQGRAGRGGVVGSVSEYVEFFC
jgi:hypothetical protein